MTLFRRVSFPLSRGRTAAGVPDTVKRFSINADGVVALLAAIMAPVLFMLTGLAIDYLRMTSEKAKLQAVADTASLAAAKELGLTDFRDENPNAVMQAIVENYFKSNLPSGRGQTYSVQTEVLKNEGDALHVEVKAREVVSGLFGPNFGMGQTEIEVGATATVIGKPNICLLALEPAKAGSIELNHKSRVVGQNCSVFANSTHSLGIKSKNDAQLSAQTICSAGGVQGSGDNFSPRPITDCPQFEDPLSGRPTPDVGPCAATSLEITDSTITLTPGTYCGGLTIGGTSRVTFDEGVYVFKDGPLIVKDTAVVEGVDTGFYFSGSAATFTFETNTTINLSAPTRGPLAGLLFFGSRDQSGSTYVINSDNAHQLLGTIYLPEGVISIDANKPIADKSAYTAIVAKRVIAFSGPTVTLNTNYDQTDVPVPDGIRGVGVPAALVR